MLRQRSTSPWPRLLLPCGLTLGLVGLAPTRDGQALLDLVSPPAQVQGAVTGRQMIVVHPGPSGDGVDFAQVRYVITLQGRAWDVSAHDYALAEASSCLTVAYGPHSGLVTDVRHCASR